MAKKKSGYTISDKAKLYIKQYKEHSKSSSQSEALERIIEDHEQFFRETRRKEIDELSDKICKKVVEQLKGAKLGINNADRNTQILIEMLNGRYIKDRVGNIVTTTGLTTETARKSEALEIAEGEVKKRIHRAKVMKSNE